MEVSTERWKEASIHSIKLAQTIIERSEYGIGDSKLNDPLPLLRDACVQESNTRIFSHMRSTRDVVIKLRKTLVATNDEIKSLNRSKEALERALEHKRKDLMLNHESSGARTYRPSREKDIDCGDQLLQAERTQLFSMKKYLEAQLGRVQAQLQVLSKARAQLTASIQERSRVTDLLCQSMTPSSQHHQSSTSLKSSSTRQIWNGNGRSGNIRNGPSSLASSRSQLILSGQPVNGTGASTNSSTRKRHHGKTLSAPAATNTGGSYAAETVGAEALTPDAQSSMKMAAEAISASQTIRKEVTEVIDQTDHLQKAAHTSVNEGLTRKLAQTVTLTQHLMVNAGETNLAHQKARRNYNSQERALGYILGPVSSSDVMTRERLDRPVVRVYQRHAGTDLPEAAHLVEASGMYSDSMEATRKNMTLLKLASRRLNDDITDKKRAARIDSDVVRLRRRKFDHKWVLKGNALPLKSTGSQPTRVRALTT